VNALITGITGFAGSHLAAHLLAEGDRLLGISRRGVWSDDVPREITRQVPLLAWDLAEPIAPPQAVLEAISRFAPEAIYHLAALSIPAQCGGGEPTAAAWATNVEGTGRVIDLALGLKRPPRLLQVSSNKVYAPVANDSPKVTERSPLGPQNGYGKTKLAAKQRMRQAAKQGLDGVIARSFQHAGPRQDRRLMLSEWARQFATPTNDPVVIRTRQAVLDLSDVRDVVRAYRRLVLRGQGGMIYNVGSGIARQSGAIFDLLRRLADPGRATLEEHGRRIQEPIADVNRLEQATAWRAEIPLERTLADTLAYWRERLAKG